MRLNRQQRDAARRAKIAYDQKGDGQYLYKNATSGALTLPKAPDPKNPASRHIPKGGTFVGDSYFMYMVKTHDLVFVEEIQAPMNKLLTEQPPLVTTQGTVEFVEEDTKKQKLQESAPQQKKPDVLLNEEPLSGMVILQ